MRRQIALADAGPAAVIVLISSRILHAMRIPHCQAICHFRSDKISVEDYQSQCLLRLHINIH